jgi:hypothetical protein
MANMATNSTQGVPLKLIDKNNADNIILNMTVFT